jgi:MFS family permease
MTIAAAARTEGEFNRSYANRTLMIFATFAIFVMYVESMLTPSLPSIASDFNVTNAQVSLILSMYLVSGVALNPVVGKLGDIYGKKKVFTYVLVIYAVAVSVSGFAPTFSFLVTSRTIQGIGLTMFPLAMSLVREEFPRDLIPRAQGILSGMFGAGFAIGLPLGAYLSNEYGWRTTYHTALPLAALFVVLVSSRVKESRYTRPNARVDYLGASLLGVALGMIVFALSQGPTWGWTSPLTLGMVMASIILLIILVVYESGEGRKEPILNLTLLGMRNVLITNIIILITGLAMFLAFQTLVYELELPPPVGNGYNIFQTGVSLVPFAIMMLILSPITGAMVSKVGVKPLAAVGSIIAAFGFLLASTTGNANELIESISVAGAGLAITMSSAINLLILTVNPREMGLATSLNTVFRTMGSSLGAPIAGSLLSTFTIWIFEGYFHGVPMFYSAPAKVAFQYSFYIAAALFLVAGIASLFSKEVLGKRVASLRAMRVGMSEQGEEEERKKLLL